MSGGLWMFWDDVPDQMIDSLEDLRTGLGPSYSCGCNITVAPAMPSVQSMMTVPVERDSRNRLNLCTYHEGWITGYEAMKWRKEQR